jgi:hypothetical protein
MQGFTDKSSTFIDFIDFIVPKCELPTSPPQSRANGLNDRGQVVGVGALVQANNAPIRVLIWEDPATNPFGRGTMLVFIRRKRRTACARSRESHTTLTQSQTKAE